MLLERLSTMEYTAVQSTEPCGWPTPVLFMSKKDGNLKPCLNYPELKTITVNNKYRLRLAMELVASLLYAYRLTKLKICNMYGDLRGAKGDEDKLAFLCSVGQISHVKIWFGPREASGHFQYLINDILASRIGKDTAAYLDDTMTYKKTKVNHKQAADGILKILSKHNLWLKLEEWISCPGYFDFGIELRPGRQSTNPDSL